MRQGNLQLERVQVAALVGAKVLQPWRAQSCCSPGGRKGQLFSAQEGEGEGRTRRSDGVEREVSVGARKDDEAVQKTRREKGCRG